MMEHLQDAPITSTQIAYWTRRDPLMSRVLRYIQSGWTNQSDEDLKPYWTRKLELSSECGCIIWCGRIVIPPPARVTNSVVDTQEYLE